VFNVDNAKIYGEYLGKRYKNKPIIWILGGDRHGKIVEIGTFENIGFKTFTPPSSGVDNVLVKMFFLLFLIMPGDQMERTC